MSVSQFHDFVSCRTFAHTNSLFYFIRVPRDRYPKDDTTINHIINRSSLNSGFLNVDKPVFGKAATYSTNPTPMSHADRPDPESILLENGKPAATPVQVLSAIESLGFEHLTIQHEPLYTVEEAKRVKYDLTGAHTKNLFLRNKKGVMLLLVIEQNRRVDLKDLRTKINLPGGQIAFASTERLGMYLGVVPGSVSPLALINDTSGKVSVYFERALMNHQFIYLHPCRNTHSTRLKTEDLCSLLESWNHPVNWLDFHT